MSYSEEKELQQQKNRLRDLAEKSFAQGIFTFTGFLDLAMQDLYRRIEPEVKYAHPVLWGGKPDADRVVLRFGDPEEFGYEEEFPIAAIHVVPLQEKFAEELSHRDYLGALMHLGIDRAAIGDITAGSKEAWFFCLKNMEEFICGNLTLVRHTRVRCQAEPYSENALKILGAEPATESFQVPSERLDVCIAKIYHMSRSQVQPYLTSGKVYVDGRLCESGARILKSGESVNVRGFGKFKYYGIQKETKKGKYVMQAAVYR